MEGVRYTGIPSAAELAACPGIPSEERMRKGRVAVIECVQEIPCNPCEGICRFGAITVGEHITNLPVLDEEKCTGCGQCVANCPGLAIVIVNKAFSETEETVEFPFEYLPLPEKGSTVDAVNRAGENVTEAFRRGAELALERALREGCRIALLKERSPSCGSGRIYDGSFTATVIPGDGVTAEMLKKSGITVYSETEFAY